MAIDSRNKRASAILPRSPFRALLPAPDTSVAEDDWPTLAFMYSGIQADFPVVIPNQPRRRHTMSISISIGF
jgi:hypothetical protein